MKTIDEKAFLSACEASGIKVEKRPLSETEGSIMVRSSDGERFILSSNFSIKHVVRPISHDSVHRHKPMHSARNKKEKELRSRRETLKKLSKKQWKW